MYAMKEGSEKVFGAGYNVLPIFKERLNAKTLVTTPNSDVIYAMGYVDLKQDGPLVIEFHRACKEFSTTFINVPFVAWSRLKGAPGAAMSACPVRTRKRREVSSSCARLQGEIPAGYLTYRSRTYGVFVFWRGFFKDPNQLEAPVKVMEQTRIYPLGKEASAKPMVFPDASATPANLLYPTDGTAFDMLSRYINHEYVDPVDMEMRGVLASIGIRKGEPFAPDAQTREMLENPPGLPRFHAASATTLLRGYPTATGTPTAAGLMCSPAMPHLQRTRLITSISEQDFLPLRILRAPGWRLTWSASARSIRQRTWTQTEIS